MKSLLYELGGWKESSALRRGECGILGLPFCVVENTIVSRFGVVIAF